MPKARRRFTSEFKSEAVRLLMEGGKPLQQVAAELGIHANQLRGWRNERLAAGSAEALARRKAEGGRRKAEGGRRKAEGGRRKAVGSRQ
jgi:transposase-like protein